MNTSPNFIVPDMSRLSKENSSFAKDLSGILRKNLESLFFDIKPGMHKFPVNATAPSVKNGHGKIFYTANTAGTVYTDFIDAEEGQKITIIVLDGNSSAVDGGNFSLSTAWNPASGDTLDLIFKGGVWYEGSIAGSVVATNAANIATNVTNIATNVTDIATNVSAIAALVSGKVVNFEIATSGALISQNSTIPYDTTIPQDNEGHEVITRAITPTKTANYLLCVGWAKVSSNDSGVYNIVGALFSDKDATADAIAASAEEVSAQYDSGTLFMVGYLQTGTTDATTISMRVGSSAAKNWEISGRNGARLGGLLKYGIIVFEIDVS